MKQILFAVTLLFSSLSIEAQKRRSLEIGDTMPTILINLLDGEDYKQVPLASLYKEQPLILDFWATWCGPCIKTISEADSLLRQTKARVLFLPISYEPKETVQKHILTNKRLQSIQFRYAVHDSILAGRLLRFKGIPHEVWIGTDGVIKAITYPEEVTAEHLIAFAQNQLPVLPVKKDRFDIDYTQPIPFDNNEILARSILTKHQAGMQRIMGTYTKAFDLQAKTNRFVGLNQSIISLYYAAFSKGEGVIRPERIELYVKDTLAIHPSFYQQAIGDKAYKQYLYCYELILPFQTNKAALFGHVLRDLNRILPYTGSIEKRKQVCWIIMNTDPTRNPAPSFLQQEAKWERGVLKELNHFPMKVLANFLNWQMDRSVIDESGFTQAIDLRFQFQFTANQQTPNIDVVSVNRSLLPYGFQLVPGERMVDVLVIREK